MTIYSIEIRDDAQEDVSKIADWYLAISSSLTERFNAELIQSFYKIQSYPLAFAAVKKRSQYRRFIMKIFPYKIYYRVEENHITVVAIIHVKRSNPYIKRRLK